MVLGTNPMFPPTALKKATGSTCVHAVQYICTGNVV